MVPSEGTLWGLSPGEGEGGPLWCGVQAGLGRVPGPGRHQHRPWGCQADKQLCKSLI